MEEFMVETQSKAEVYLMALLSLSKKERNQVLSRVVEDRKVREDLIDLLVHESRKGEPSELYKYYSGERKKRGV
jgi:hypothetical protein